jgi:hypothetical protein
MWWLTSGIVQAVVELDRVPDKSRTPKEPAIIRRDYLEQKIGVTV